jgi:putative membrane protein
MTETVTVADLFTRWDIPWGITSALVVSGVIYIRGWLRIRQTRPDLFPRWRLGCFLGGLLAIFVAVSSPLDTFSESLLFMHMAQHWALMSIAPPLIVFGAPVVPMLRGLPRWIIRRPLRPLFETRALHAIGGFLTRPRVAWLAMNAAYLCWHIPAAYEFALSSENWHNCEHACFFLTNLMFWWPVIQPWPSRSRFNRWLLIPYLGLAEIVNTGISACLCFCGRLLYPSYAAVPRLFGISALNDQVTAGAFMWICGTMVYAIAGVVVIAQLLSANTRDREIEPVGAEEAWWSPVRPAK